MGGKGSGRKPYPQAKFTKKLAKEIVDLIAQGNYFETACHAVGLSSRNGRRWLLAGARGETRALSDFASAVKKAEAKAEASAVNGIRYHGRKTWQSLAWYLERKHPKRWAKRDVKIEPVGKTKDGEPIFKFVLSDGD